LIVVAAPAAFGQQQNQTNDMLNQVIDKIIAREKVEMDNIHTFSPLVETYIQNLRTEKDGAPTPAGDTYFIGRARFDKGLQVESLIDAGGFRKGVMSGFSGIFSTGLTYVPVGFLEMVFLDKNGFDRENYKFDYVRREFLGEVRCLVFDVTPEESKGHHAQSRFVGRIWVEDKDFTIVRFNGAYNGGSREKVYFHFDSWRMNTGPNMWLPSFIYSEEKDLHASLVGKAISFKAQTRLWGYNLGHSKQEQELGRILVEANAPINDQTTTNNDVSPLQAQRSWDRQAEDNVIDRLERLGLLSPKGEVDTVLEKVVNNIEVTNNLDIQPEIRCRVLLNSTLESVSIGHTIILSRGLIDVLPDEASLATVLAGEVAHIVLGHRVDTQFAFFDRVLMFNEKETFQHFDFARTKEEDDAASAKAAELLKNSNYKDQLKTAQLFFGELRNRAKEIPNLISPKLGNAVLLQAPVEAQANATPEPNQIVALPLGGRVKLDPWDDKLEMLKSKSVGSISEREKMPFEVTPFMPYLVRQSSGLPPTNINAEVKQNDKNPQQK
ncbi:MAG: M48 family metalloprotease, partial [Candidatus Acidiferrales bacterium]